MSLEFAHSPRGTVGLEWEVALVDLETRDLVPRASEVLERLPDGTRTTGEYLACMVEMITGVHRTIPAAVADLREQLDALHAAARPLGLGVLAAGTHPFAVAAKQPIVEHQQYDVVRKRNAWWGRQMLVCGTHVHVGVDRDDIAMPMVQWLSRFYPHLLALSASSPFFEGDDTGFASQRTMLFQQLPTNGLPYAFRTWADYAEHLDELAAVGMIGKPSELRWDVRPSPGFGTVEARIMDSSPTLAELGCVAAWVQCLGVHLMRLADAGADPAPAPRWFLRENKWRAARYGLDAEIVQQGERRALRDSIADWWGRLAPLADELGCRAELDLTGRLLDEGPSYVRQRTVASQHGGSLEPVVDALVHETITGRPT